jgi:hypothetical protein
MTAVILVSQLFRLRDAPASSSAGTTAARSAADVGM